MKLFDARMKQTDGRSRCLGGKGCGRFGNPVTYEYARCVVPNGCLLLWCRAVQTFVVETRLTMGIADNNAARDLDHATEGRTTQARTIAHVQGRGKCPSQHFQSRRESMHCRFGWIRGTLGTCGVDGERTPNRRDRYLGEISF